MATIIEYTKTGDRYILLGAGFGQWAMARPNRLLGDLFATEQADSTELLCVCDALGDIFWIDPNEAAVISVDGLTPAQTLAT